MLTQEVTLSTHTHACSVIDEECAFHVHYVQAVEFILGVAMAITLSHERGNG